MAIFHCAVNVISRSKGKCAVAAAAYRSGQKLQDERQNITFDYSNKPGVVHSEIMTPSNAPNWGKDREKLWNAVEASEKRKDAQLCREVTIALPIELRQNEWVELVREYCQSNFINKGMIADFNIHADNPNNPHAHIMLTLREISSEGFGNKVREWNNPQLVAEQRKSLEELTNIALHKAGIDKQVDCRSHAEKGSDLKPNLHLGPAAHHALKRGDNSFERTQNAFEVLHQNGEDIIKNPERALNFLTEKSSTFSDHDIKKFANSYSADNEQFKLMLETIKSSEKLVALGQDESNKPVYTSKEMIKLEHSMFNHVYELEAKQEHAVSPQLLNSISETKTLTPGQIKALEHITKPGDFKTVIGFAGTGKSYLMGCAKEIWETSGFKVRGMALSGIASENLQQGSNIKSRTIDSYINRWQQGKDLLGKNDILVVDEAGMLDTRRTHQLMSYANLAGAKVVVLGDDEQLAAINAGAPFRACVERLGAASLFDIIRQFDPNDPEKTHQMRLSTYELETQKTDRALERYARMGSIITSRNRDDAMAKIIENWNSYQKANPDKSQMMMAYTRSEVKELNEAARQQRINNNEIQPGKEFEVSLNRDDKTVIENRNFSMGDKIFFLRNEKGLGVKNGSRGTVEKIVGTDFTVKLEGKEGKTVQFNINHYNHLDHGYAGTVHKNQGSTVDKAYVLTSQHWDRHLSCVALTRHRLDVEIHSPEDKFKSFSQLVKTMSRENSKDLALDYAHMRDIELQNNSNFDARIIEKTQREFALERIEERRLSEANGTQFEFLKPGQEFSGFVEKSIILKDGTERGIIKDKKDIYKILPESNEVKKLTGQFVTATLGNDGKLCSLTSLHINGEHQIVSKEYIQSHPEQLSTRSEKFNADKNPELSESYFLPTPSLTIGRELEIDIGRHQ